MNIFVRCSAGQVVESKGDFGHWFPVPNDFLHVVPNGDKSIGSTLTRAGLGGVT